ncbi:ribonuclease H-like domain-containing protein [Tanacetum coccineum]
MNCTPTAPAYIATRETLLPNAFGITNFQDPTWNMDTVANGSTHQLCIDCDETSSPVVKPTTIHIVLSLALTRHWPVHQLDVMNAFLNVDLSETVYMHRPPDFVDPRYPLYTG